MLSRRLHVNFSQHQQQNCQNFVIPSWNHNFWLWRYSCSVYIVDLEEMPLKPMLLYQRTFFFYLYFLISMFWSIVFTNFKIPIIIDFDVIADMFLLLNLKKLLFKFSKNYFEDVFLLSSLLTFSTLLLLLLQVVLTQLFFLFYFLLWIYYSTLLIVDFVLAPFLSTLKNFSRVLSLNLVNLV